MEDSDIDPEIAAAMGFGSFGTQPNAKRRKLGDDAVVDPDFGRGKGANSIPLGMKRQMNKDTATQADQSEDGRQLGQMTSKSQPETHAEQPSTQPDLPSKFSSAVGQNNETQESQVPLPPLSSIPGESVQQSSYGASASQNSMSSEILLNKSLEELDPQDLYHLRKGIAVQDGSIVYFQKSFIEDPWKDHQAKNEAGFS